MNRKQIFFTSDWHIGHENVIKFSNRPYANVEEMHKVLIRNFNKQVPTTGVTYFLGDIGVSSTAAAKAVLDQLNGLKILISGNHDKRVYAMYNAGFDVVLQKAHIIITGELVSMTHCPMLGKYREDTTNMKGGTPGDPWHGASKERYDIFTLEEHEGFHLHGHIHSPNKGRSKKIENKQFDVGIDANNYRPVHISEIESFIAKVKQNDK